MPVDEFHGWLSYLKHKKPDVTEQQLAVLSTIVANALGGKAKVEDFLISSIERKDEKVKPMEASAIKAILGSASKPH